MIVVDTGALFAAIVETEQRHRDALRALEAEPPPYALSPFVLCELDSLLLSRTDVETEVRFLDEVLEGAFELASFGGDDLAVARDLVARYRDLRLGLADASIVVLAGKLGTNRVLTLDERHFRAVRTVDGKPFELLPADLG